MGAVTKAGSAPARSEAVVPPVVLGGRYELGPLVGLGGSGQVYRGLDRSLRRQVAVPGDSDSDHEPAPPASECESGGAELVAEVFHDRNAAPRRRGVRPTSGARP